ncbi:ergothioneine biosynthesis protein EgtC [Saccharopolyspora rosea]|uniref:ergothioneine biosynthesis protein EgtC n=1 Tax=Saccharopolyspora rosea TaxID=524884 RepID=UPI0021DADA19|nr:ergothioneine biosynthesis protein EgtC [Saccharopolyspora rosea]
MCRHMAYLGPPASLAELLLEPEHGLLEQSYAPRDMRGGGTINADGFGVGWYSDGAVRRYRSARPMWTDASFAEFAGGVRSGAVLGAARSATLGMPVVETACAPFTDGIWLFSHNGRIAGWPESAAKQAARLDVVDLLTLDAPTDSALLWALLRQRLGAGADPAGAVAELVGEIAAAAPDSRLNLLLTDGTRLIATTWTHALWVRRGAGAVTAASEPFGGGGWTEIDDRRLVVADRDGVRVTALVEGDR